MIGADFRPDLAAQEVAIERKESVVDEEAVREPDIPSSLEDVAL